MPEQPLAYRALLKTLLYDLFQFDSLDLDFGFYAVMNQRRAEIADFIENRLLDSVNRALAGMDAQGRQEMQATLDKARARVLRDLSDDALDGDELAPAYRNSGIGKEYQAAKTALAAADLSADVEAQVFNDLYNFFARYYQDGDFIAQRRYGSADHYAIPYNGQEVYLHWANADQYYVKSGAFFQNYAFKLPANMEHSAGVTVNFRLAKVDTPRDNVKGDKRLFVLATEPAQWDALAQTLTLFFEYRPLTDAEAKRLGKQKQQDKLLDEAHAAILKAAPTATITAQLSEPDPARPAAAGRLAYHLNRYAIANTRDFFVHKDLRGFLTRELDFYLKAEVLQLDDLDLADPASLRRTAARTAAIRTVALDIIAFLDQLESFQRRLFLKRKFVLQSDYCLTLDKLPAAVRADFYPEILANTAQRAQWASLYGLELGEDADLGAHPRLMVDTALFPAEFKAKVLEQFEDLDAATDGLLVHSENFQALRLLIPRYEGQVKCVHIDPPYNTQTSGFLYKNNYQHSSWLSMMENRTLVALSLLNPDGSFICHIDENEYERLHALLDMMYVPNAGTIAWDKRNPMNSTQGIATQHEYVVWRTWRTKPLRQGNQNALTMMEAAATIVQKHGAGTREAQQEYASWIASNKDLSGGEKAYRYLDEKGRPYQSVSLRAPEPRTDKKFFKPLKHPVTGKPCPVPPNGFSRTPETLKAMQDAGSILFGTDETTQPRQKVLLDKETRKQITSVITEGRKGKADLAVLGLDFPYCHPVPLYEELVSVAADSTFDVVLDYFAGSGTTGHAVIKLNREDNGKRKYILVEMGDYFDSVLKPRIMKVAYAPEWKDGKPVLPAPSLDLDGEADAPHMFHYIRLESYDDTFHNLTLRSHDAEAQTLLDGLDDYMLTYRLDHLTTGSPTLLNVAAFARPFDYRLKVTGSDGVLAERPVDLVTTFNFLLGLSVRTVRTFTNPASVQAGAGGTETVMRVLGANRRGERICVLWRNVPDLDDPAALDAERDWLLATVLVDADYDVLYVNGETTLPRALSTEDEFQRRMMEGVA